MQKKLRHLKIFTTVILFLVTGFCAFAQSNDPIEFQADTVPVKKTAVEETRSPKKATLYSAILPGLGQIYNKKYWKVPIIYGGFIGFGYAINWNNNQYVTYRQAYADIIDNDPNTNSYEELVIEGAWDWDNPTHVSQFTTRLERAKNSARRNRDFMIILTAGFYALNIIDATVDAHFFNFDISDDIAMKWAAGPVLCAGKAMPGIQLNFRF